MGESWQQYVQPGLVIFTLWIHITSTTGIRHSRVPEPSQGPASSPPYLCTRDLHKGTSLSWHRPQLGREGLAWLGAWVEGQGGKPWPASSPQEQMEGLEHCLQWVVTSGQMKGMWPWSLGLEGGVADAGDKHAATGVIC